MATRLSDLVVEGEIYHSSAWAVSGRIYLRGSKSPLLLELTGAPAADLCGRRFEFEVEANDHPASAADRKRVAALQKQQIGATGQMSVVQRRTLPEEGAEAGSQQPCLYLEWFGQNGRMVLEL